MELTECKSASTPKSLSHELSRYKGTPLDDPKAFKSIVGALQYCTLTRPDLNFAVNKLCQFIHSPTDIHWQALKRVLRFLKGTLNHGILLQKSNSPLDLTTFSDADWAFCVDNRRSTSGFCVFLGDSLVFWHSGKQHVVSRSSTESEYRAAALVAMELLWIRGLLTELRIILPRCPLLLCDNMSTRHLIMNPIFHARTKHIELDHHFIREQVVNGSLEVQFVPSLDQLADILTKPLFPSRFGVLRTKLSVLSLSGSPLHTSSIVTGVSPFPAPVTTVLSLLSKLGITLPVCSLWSCVLASSTWCHISLEGGY